MPSQHEKIKILKASSKQKSLSQKKKTKNKKNYVFGRIGRIGRIPYDLTILYDSTRSYVQSYHFYDPSAILIVLVRWDRKIVRSYDPDRDFDNHGKKSFVNKCTNTPKII